MRIGGAVDLGELGGESRDSRYVVKAIFNSKVGLRDVKSRNSM
jgi:hypothetical protein